MPFAVRIAKARGDGASWFSERLTRIRPSYKEPFLLSTILYLQPIHGLYSDPLEYRMTRDQRTTRNEWQFINLIAIKLRLN